MIEREDGPIKHYRMVCDKCGKQTKRFAYGFDFKYNAPKGWTNEEGNWNSINHCPNCASNKVEVTVKEVAVKNGFQISDHEEVDLSIKRQDNNTLVINMSGGEKVVITSAAEIKVHHHSE